MTEAQQREAARQFINKWLGRGNEDEDGRSYWIELLHNVLGMENVTDRVEFEKKVYVDGNKKRIDVYIPETRVLIEQKSLGKALDQKIHNSGDIDLTPYEQAKRYNDNLSFSETAKWIVTCNFAEIRIYDMEHVNSKDFEPIKLELVEIQTKYPLLRFLVKKEVKKISDEMEISIKAGDIVGKIYDAFIKQYKDPTNEHSLKSLNALCVRLVFCLYAEDAGIFGERDMFHDYLQSFPTERMRNALIDLFRVLDKKEEDRDPYLVPELAAFPYVNGGLFSDENIEIPMFTEEIRELILKEASENFNWSAISPTIFGAVFESTLNPETRRSGGMHYTSIENIHKVIDPLFLDALKAEFEEIKKISAINSKRTRLDTFQKKLASLAFFDPAAGSGNFLTETYLSLRRLENEVIREKTGGQMSFGSEEFANPIQVSIQQFYGIEINDFAVTVAKTALWIAESQMLEETKSILWGSGFNQDFLPLKTYVNIMEGNALRLDWEKVVSKEKLTYIMGNPPFVGARLMSANQKEDINLIFDGWKNVGNFDYVCGWYKKASDYMTGTEIRTALVSTNSVSQGDAVPTLWASLFNDGVHIDFAYQTFAWNSEASVKAHVHCVIIGFSKATTKQQKVIFSDGEQKEVTHINAYLIEAQDVFVSNRSKPICDVPVMGIGSQPIDNGNYLFDSKEDMETFIAVEPRSKKYFHLWYGSREFIDQKPRYCLYLGDCSPADLRSMPHCLERVKAVQVFRSKSNRASTKRSADTPARFGATNIPDSNYIVVPKVSSQRRRYIPMGFMTSDILCSDLVFLLPNAELYHFGILESNVHMAWTRVVCGRLKSDYRYSNTIVYNNFPWPTPTEEQKKRIEATAQGILDARNLYSDSSLADLYDPLTMPTELRKAHTANDIAVMKAYGFSTKMSEADCVAELMKMYRKLTEQ